MAKSARIKRILLSFALAVVFVGGIKVAADAHLWTPAPFLLLLPGIVVGAVIPDSGFNPEGDVHPWGPFSQAAVYAVDILLYSLVVFLLLWLVRLGQREEV